MAHRLGENPPRGGAAPIAGWTSET